MNELVDLFRNKMNQAESERAGVLRKNRELERTVVELERRLGNIWAVRGLLEQINLGLDNRYGRDTPVGGEEGRPEVCVGVRPHDMSIVEASAHAIPFTPSILETLGPEVHAHGTFGAHEGVVAVSADLRLARGVMVHVRPTRLYLFDQATGATLR